MSAPDRTAAASGFARCDVCEALVRWDPLPPGSERRCPRCDSPVELRRPNSLARTWALVLAAYVMYLPANLFAMTVIEHLGSSEGDTILSGVQELLAAGWYPVAILIFIASITVPLAKLVSLTGLLISVQRRSRWRPRDRAALYRVVEQIGRWSMLDVFVLTLLIALVQLGNLMTIEVGRASTFFASVVVLTIFAAKSFDPRLIWDAMEEPE
jgi:paraquat-inducible protein A